MRIPSATYRIQFNLNFRFRDAEALVPYLHELGVSDLYASPRFRARKGSSHGYDVADPAHINSELGTEEEFNRLVRRLHQYGMGLLLDIVPNHMAIAEENPWWMDVLENGRDSRYAQFFDIDWHPLAPKLETALANRVILPILADPYDEILLRQGIRLSLDNRGFFFQYEDHRLPVNPRTYSLILGRSIEVFTNFSEAETEELRYVCKLAAALANTINDPDGSATSRPGIFGTSLGAQRASAPNAENGLDQREKWNANLKASLWSLYRENPAVHRAIDESLRILNGTPGESESFQPLDQILSRQAYRLAWWRLAADEINYRRFFAVNELIGLRVEDPVVFAARHGTTMQLMQQGKISGLRVDHIDGLLDPLEYLERLASIPLPCAEKDTGPSHVPRSVPQLYTIVEKITSGTEALPSEWPVHGTTGYDFLNALNAVFISPHGFEQIEGIYKRFAQESRSFADTWYLTKKQVIADMFRTDLRLLVYRLGKVAALVYGGRDLPLTEIERGLIELTACLPVYRTYFRGLELKERNRMVLEKALAAARERASTADLSDATFQFLRGIFLLDSTFTDQINRCGEQDKQSDVRPAPNPIANVWLSFVQRWQQFTGSVMAKGLEDTALFSWPALLSVNEVGNNPFHREIPFGTEAFHEFNQRRLKIQPNSLNATSTHDTKWSEDVRARLNVLSEIPRQWQEHLRKWSRLNQPFKTRLGDKVAPTPAEEILFYQAMLGIWPLDDCENQREELKTRLERFFIKAAREAKTETNWLAPNESHETELRNFVSAILDSAAGSEFMEDFLKFQQKIAFLGAWNSCAQLILKITSPGVPDFYQGSELWNFRLTDPDNREPVDFRLRTTEMEALRSAGPPSAEFCRGLVENWQNGRFKLYATKRALGFRRSHSEIFTTGSYVPLECQGSRSDSICAFLRAADGDSAIIVVPRLLAKFVKPQRFPVRREIWGRSALVLPAGAEKTWTDVFTCEALKVSRSGGKLLIPIASIFKHFPFSILTSAASGHPQEKSETE